LGWWLREAHDIVQAMTYYILEQNGQIISRSKVQLLANEEMNSNAGIMARNEFTKLVREIITLLDTNLVSSPDVFIIEKDRCNQVEDIPETLEKAPPPSQKRSGRGLITGSRNSYWGRSIYRKIKWDI